MIFPKIALDLDGVVVDFHQKLLNVYNKRYGKNVTVNDINCDLESLGPEITKKIISIFNEPGWFLELKPLPNAISIISKYIDFGYRVTICTAPARDLKGIINPISASEKFTWVRENLPFWANNIIITKYKEFVHTDAIIDDYSPNIVNWCQEHPEGIGFLVDQPWNKYFKQYPINSVRGKLEDVTTIINKHWCHVRGRFVFRLEELEEWQT